MKNKIDYAKVISELKEKYSDKIETIYPEKDINGFVIKIVLKNKDVSDIPSEYLGVKVMILDKYDAVFGD